MMPWQQRNKYVRFTKRYPHYQVEKFNGTKGHVWMDAENIGVYKEATKNYVFKSINGVVPEFIEGLLLSVEKCGMVKFSDSIHSTTVYDEDHKRHIERLEVRLLKAKSCIDVDWSWIMFKAAEADRLSIKLSLMKLNKTE